MRKIGEDEQEQTSQNYQKLITEQKTLLLSTVSAQGEPECSYAPFIRESQGEFYIFVSELASHTKNLLQNLRASAMLIQNEIDSNNLFARERAIFDCKVCEIKRDDESYITLLDRMTERLGETVSLLRSLPDFHLLKLTPVKGRYIAGFGQAFMIDTSKDVLEF